MTILSKNLVSRLPFRLGAALTIITIISTVAAAQAHTITPTKAASASKPKPAVAPLFQSKLLIRSAETIEVDPGEAATLTVGFKNTGRAAWKHEGANFVSIYTWNPKYRSSAFSHASWMSNRQLVRLRESQAAPGQVGFFTFTLQAPDEPGQYQETFALAAEDRAWIAGGVFTVNITVRDPEPYRGVKLISSKTPLVLKRGESGEFRVGFKNIGQANWNERGLRLTGFSVSSENVPSFVHPGWASATEPSRIVDASIKPGELSFLQFRLRAPQLSGNYTLNMKLFADEHDVLGGDLELPITVTSESVSTPDDEPLKETTTTQALLIGSEPLFRVGLCPMGEEVPGGGLECPAGALTVSADQEFEVRDGLENIILVMPAGEKIRAEAAGTAMSLITPAGRVPITQYLRLSPKNSETIFTIENMNNTIASGVNDNRFRGALELRIAEKSGRLWLVNELPLELYLRGLAETPNDWPIEFQKAQATAARTYAIFNFLAGGKHSGAPFILNAGAYDQVYRGYGSELRRPALVAAIAATRGIAVLWEGKVVTTPYFAQSDGRTRNWQDVWGGAPRPWLVSKPTVYDVGKRKRGHGVGMPQTDARGRAAAGAGFEEILLYYYSGVTAQRVYQ